MAENQELKRYDTEVNGVETTFSLTEDEARNRGIVDGDVPAGEVRKPGPNDPDSAYAGITGAETAAQVEDDATKADTEAAPKDEGTATKAKAPANKSRTTRS